MEQVQKRPVLKILEAGLYDIGYLNATNIIGKKYGLSYEIVGGCTESKEFYDSLETHNKKVFAQLAHEFDEGWEKKFMVKTDSMEFLVSQAESLVERTTDYKKRSKELETKGIILALWTEPTETNDVFKVEAYDYGMALLPADSNRKVYYSWDIDLAKHKILNSFCNDCR